MLRGAVVASTSKGKLPKVDPIEASCLLSAKVTVSLDALLRPTAGEDEAARTHLLLICLAIIHCPVPLSRIHPPRPRVQDCTRPATCLSMIGSLLCMLHRIVASDFFRSRPLHLQKRSGIVIAIGCRVVGGPGGLCGG